MRLDTPGRSMPVRAKIVQPLAPRRPGARPVRPAVPTRRPRQGHGKPEAAVAHLQARTRCQARREFMGARARVRFQGYARPGIPRVRAKAKAGARFENLRIVE